MLMCMTLVMFGVVGVTNARSMDSSEMEVGHVEQGIPDTKALGTLMGGNDVTTDPPKYTWSRRVAFSAYLTSDRQNLGKKQHIKFDGIQLNDGKGYEPSTGVFRAPYSGVYSFTVTVGFRGRGEITVRLVQGGKTLASAVAEGTCRYHDVQGSNTVNVHVCKDKPVWVEVSYGNKIRGATSEIRPTTFSGFLLYEKS